MTASQPYDPDAPLPGPGLLVLEASAGTGKTHAIANLVGRFIAEGEASIDELLVMTFSRSATQELRDRVRRTLRSLAADRTLDADARQRVGQALAEFDGAAIMTIHEFCIDAFARFGIRADADPGEAIVEEISDTVAAAASDAFLARFRSDLPLAEPDAGGVFRTTELSPASATKVAKALVANPDAELITTPETTLAPDEQRIEFALDVSSRVTTAKRRAGAVSFDDVVIRLRKAVQKDEAARAMLRSRFRVVLVDEFQDTDPSQWAIIHDTFLHPVGPVVVLIGDPKQGIYSFRGADINSYTAARDTPGSTLRTLQTNYRSDAPVVQGVLGIMEGLELGEGIEVGAVRAKQKTTRLTGPGVDPAGRRVRLRVIHGSQQLAAAQSEELVVADVAAEIRRTLDEGALITPATWTDQPSTAKPRAVRPGDFAVIVRTNRQAELIRSKLFDVGLPAVVNSQVSVFGSEAARAWLALLRAMETPSAANIRAAAVTEFFSATPAQIADPDEPALERVAESFPLLVEHFNDAGVPAVLAAASSTLLARVLRRQDGERFLTDLRHIASLMHEDQRRLGLGLAGLVDWLATRVADAQEDDDERSEALTRRLDTDADAVQVVTIHRCKGLQYGITYVPFGYQTSTKTDPAVICTTDEGTAPPRKRRIIDVRSYDTKSRVAARFSQTTRFKNIRKAEIAAEDLRMFYVALTRGVHEVVVTWAPHSSVTKSPLHRILSAERGAPDESYKSKVPPLDKAAASPDIKIEILDPDNIALDISLPPVTAYGGGAQPLAAAPYTRDDIDSSWTRASFTALTKSAAHAPGIDVEGEKTDEPPPEPGLLSDLPAGMSFGTVVHAVLEHLDTAAADIDAELLRRCTEQLRERPIRDLAPQTLAAALRPPLTTALGRLAPGTSLLDVHPRDRLAELGFELPMHQGAGARVAAIGRLLADARGEPAWVRPYGESLAAADFSRKALRGFLTGEIDAVLRIGGRYLVVDYKTNLLPDYRPAALPAAMAHRNYPLQGLLYSVALHRFLSLRLRLPDYDPAVHLGGIGYLFLRGMNGPATPTDANGDPNGVFSWRPDPSLIEALSDLLGGTR